MATLTANLTETITETKCACPQCTCMVSLDTAIMANDKLYCSRACADGHPVGSSGCKKSGCGCG